MNGRRKDEGGRMKDEVGAGLCACPDGDGRPLSSVLRPLFVLVCLFVWAWSGVCGGAETEPEMTASLVPNQTSVGGIITLTLQFQLPEGAHLAPETEVTGLEGFQVLDRHVALKRPEKTMASRKVSLCPFPGNVAFSSWWIALIPDRWGPFPFHM